MTYWKEIHSIESSIESSINQQNAFKLRAKSQLCASFIESSKLAMNIGRTNRAWAFLLLAKVYWKEVK